jgi:hypothetical protein
MSSFYELFGPLPIWSRWIIGVLLPAIGALIIYASRNYFKASAEFRDVVYTKLEGIYPNIPAYLSIEEKDIRTQNSINPINSAGAKFRHYLPFLCIGFFDRALDNYCDTARKTNWDQDRAFEIYRKSMAKPGQLSPGETFRNSVKRLLKFAR